MTGSASCRWTWGHGESDHPGAYSILHRSRPRRHRSAGPRPSRCWWPSLGSHVASQFAGLYPDVPRALVLVEGMGPPARLERRHPRVPGRPAPGGGRAAAHAVRPKPLAERAGRRRPSDALIPVSTPSGPASWPTWAPGPGPTAASSGASTCDPGLVRLHRPAPRFVAIACRVVGAGRGETPVRRMPLASTVASGCRRYAGSTSTTHRWWSPTA